MSIERLKEVRDYARLWLERSQEAAKAAPEVRKVADQLDWEIRTFESRPLGTINVSSTQLDRHADALAQRVTAALPMTPKVDLPALTLINTITTSTTAYAMTYVMQASAVGPQPTVEWATQAVNEYREMQDAHRRPDEVRALVSSAFPGLVEKFDAGRGAYERWSAGHGSPQETAIEMRTFLDGLKGCLLERARRHKGENMTEPLMIERLFTSADARNDVAEEMKRRPSLYSDLSGLAKRRGGKYEVDALWSRVLDHAFIVLTAMAVL